MSSKGYTYFDLDFRNEAGEKINITSLAVLKPITNDLLTIYTNEHIEDELTNPITDRKSSFTFYCSNPIVDIVATLEDGSNVVKNGVTGETDVIAVNTTISYNTICRINGVDTSINSIKTKKITIGFSDDSGCDYNFASDALTVTIENILPAYSKCIDVTMVSDIYKEGVVESPKGFETTATLGTTAIWTSVNKIQGCSVPAVALPSAADTDTDLVIAGALAEETTYANITANIDAKITIAITYIDFFFQLSQ